MISVFNLYWALLFKRTTLGLWDAHPKATAKYQLPRSMFGGRMAGGHSSHAGALVLHLGILPREVVEATGLKAPSRIMKPAERNIWDSH